MAKLSALLFLLPLIIFIIIQLLIDNLRLQNLFKGITGFIIVVIPFLILFVLPSIEHYSVFFSQIGSEEIVSIFEIILSFILSIKYFMLMKNPDTVLVMIGAIFYFTDLIFRFFRNGILNEIMNLFL